MPLATPEALGLRCRDALDEAAIDARLLLQHVLGVDHAWLIAHIDDELTDAQVESFEYFLARRLEGEPIAYILGMREFYGLLLKTTPATLIPRPDTETLVEAALDKLAPHQNLKVLDLGTGTGAVALAIARNRPYSHVTAVDFSHEALSVAKENAKNLGLARVRLMQSDWFSSLQGEKFDVIVSNPPYIPNLDPHLIQGDLRFEPQQALTDFADGLEAYRQIIAKAGTYIQDDGVLALEHGFDQSAQVCELLEIHGFTNLTVHHDLAKIPRAVSAKLR